jgi:hypothetical protein
MPKGPKPLTYFVTFDLLATEIETKANFFSHIQAYAKGITQGKLVISTVKGLNDDSIDLNTGLEVFEDYLASGSPVNLTNVEMLAIDCVESSRARAKIYVNSFNNSYN